MKGRKMVINYMKLNYESEFFLIFEKWVLIFFINLVVMVDNVIGG